MKRDLLIQMKNEWRNNLWLAIGLAIVSLAIWVLGTSLYAVIYPTFFPRGFDPENVYSAEFRTLEQGEDGYTEFVASDPDDKANNEYSVNLRGLLAALRANENVEAVALARNAMPYNMSFWGNFLKLEGDTIGYYANNRFASPDIVKVLKLHSRTGKTEEELTELLRNGEYLVSNVIHPLVEDENKLASLTAEDVYGKKVNGMNGSEEYARVGDIIDYVKRSDYIAEENGTAFEAIDESGRLSNIWEVLIRVKPGRGAKFQEQMATDPSLNKYGNTYISRLTKLEDEGVATDRDKTVEARMYTVVIVLLIVIIFLGMLGTFWFRMQERVSEIAIRKVCGATSSAIFRRVISEGLLLVLFASILAAIVGWVVMRVTDVTDGLPYSSVVVIEVLTMVLVAIGITISVSYPAYRAMKIEPAIAIKAE